MMVIIKNETSFHPLCHTREGGYPVYVIYKDSRRATDITRSPMIDMLRMPSGMTMVGL